MTVIDATLLAPFYGHLPEPPRDYRRKYRRMPGGLWYARKEWAIQTGVITRNEYDQIEALGVALFKATQPKKAARLRRLGVRI